MRIVIFGAGGVGGYFGAKLALSGVDVTFVARGVHLEAIRTKGLTIRSPEGEIPVNPATATNDVATIGPPVATVADRDNVHRNARRMANADRRIWGAYYCQ